VLRQVFEIKETPTRTIPLLDGGGRASIINLSIYKTNCERNGPVNYSEKGSPKQNSPNRYEEVGERNLLCHAVIACPRSVEKGRATKSQA